MRRTAGLLVAALLLTTLLGGCGFIISRLPRVTITPPAKQSSQDAEGARDAQAAPDSVAAGVRASDKDDPSGAAPDDQPKTTATGPQGGQEDNTAPAEEATSQPAAREHTEMGKLPKPQGSSGSGKPRTRYVPIGSQRALTQGDLQGLSKWQLDIVRNEIYAVHGRRFDRADLRNYFRSKSWYREDAGFTEARLSSLEKRNADFVARYQRGSGRTAAGSRRSSSGSSGGYVLPFSSSRQLTAGDLSGLSRGQLDIARNEIYARHGRPFKRADLRNYFRSKSWYHEDGGFSEARLSALEKRNAEFIRRYQH